MNDLKYKKYNGVGNGLSGLFTTVALGWELDRRLLRREHPGACVIGVHGFPTR